MFTVKSHYCVYTRLLPRYVNNVAATMSGIKLETQQPHQLLNESSTRATKVFKITTFHTSAIQSRDLLMKMLNQKKKKRWYENPQPVATSQPGFLTPTKKKNQEDSQRVRTLNIIVYKAVSDLLTSHEVHADIPSYSVEVTKVSFTADFSSCRIYWMTSMSADRDGKVQQLLDKSAPRVRYLLMSLQILNNVPPIVFVRDKKYAALKEIENLLETADYGPREDSEHLSFDGKADETRLHALEPLDKKKALWFDIDHDTLQKQIEEYKQRSRDTPSESTSSQGLTQQQLDLLAEIRKQKIIEKKKRKSKKAKDDDISPKAFLLARQLEKEKQEGEYGSEHDSEEWQVSDLVADYSKKH